MAYPTGPQHASIDPDPDRPPAIPEAIAFVASGAKSAQEAKVELVDRYGNVPPDEAEVIVALGGDGFMLESMHRYMALQTPIFGMNRGTIGFLMNTYEAEELPHRLARGQHQTLRPLRMTANSEGGNRLDAVAFNEVSMLRQERQAAKLRLFINDRERMEELICDGIIVSTAPPWSSCSTPTTTWRSGSSPSSSRSARTRRPGAPQLGRGQPKPVYQSSRNAGRWMMARSNRTPGTVTISVSSGSTSSS